MLIAHIIFAAIMLGNMVAFLIFSIAAATANDEHIVQSCYQAMNILSKTSMRASTIGTTVTGILLCVWTKWGLFQYYWLLAKEGLTIFSIILNLWAMHVWTLDALHIMQMGDRSEDLFFVQTELWTGIIFQILSLIFMYVISVFKPWGKRVNSAK